MSKADSKYLSACQNILIFGADRKDRTGTGTKSVFGLSMRFNLEDEFPILTTKEVHWPSVVHELLWFLRGDTNIEYLRENKVKIWDAWATEDGEVGDMYGVQWRKWIVPYVDGSFGEADQIGALIKGIKENPDSRRHIVSAWNVAHLPNESLTPRDNVRTGNMALAPCHYSFQCYVSEGKLSMLVNQRSADMFLGVPFNIASYALLTHMIAQVCDLEVGELIWNGGDCHIYKNHISQVETQIARYAEGKWHPAPTLKLNPDIKDIDNFTIDDIELINYKHEPKLKGKVAI